MNRPVVVTSEHRISIRMNAGQVMVVHVDANNVANQQAWGPYPAIVVLGAVATGNWRSLCPSLPLSARLRETVVHFDVAVR